MAWTSMHFAVGMGCAGAAFGLGCLLRRRSPRWLPFVMTLGGLWAIVPDAPRLWREDFPWLPFARTLGARSLEVNLHSMGDLFFFHQSLDAQPHEYSLHGLMLIILLYNLAGIMQLWRERRHRIIRKTARHEDHPGLKFDGQAIRSSHLQRTG